MTSAHAMIFSRQLCLKRQIAVLAHNNFRKKGALKNTVSVTLLILLLTSMLTLALNIQPAEADAPTIYINVDGSITPVGAPIVTSDNITYTFSGNISTTELYDLTTGLNLTETSDVTIENTNIKDFYYGIYLDSSSNNTVSGN